MNVKHPTWSPACPCAAFGCPFRNQEGLEERRGNSTMSDGLKILKQKTGTRKSEEFKMCLRQKLN